MVSVVYVYTSRHGDDNELMIYGHHNLTIIQFAIIHKLIRLGWATLKTIISEGSDVYICINMQVAMRILVSSSSVRR